MNLLSLIIIIVVVIELGLYLLISILRKKFPWIITEQDELPTFDTKALQKFFDYSFDQHLGWVRKPNSCGTENGQKGIIKFNIDSVGSRSCCFETSYPVVAAFGDSYTFCRQVEDDETWEVQLSQKG